MVGKAFAGFVVTFWLATMGALVRLEFFPKPQPMDAVPSSRVLQRIFSNPEPARLNVFYRDQPIGHCNVEIVPLAATDALQPAPPGQEPQAYRMTTDLTMTLSVFGLPSRLRLKGESVFDARYAVQRFDIATKIADGRVQIHGDKATGKVDVSLEMPEYSDQRTFGFDQVQDAGLANALGLPGLVDFGFFGAGSTAGSSRDSRRSPVTTTSFDRLTIGEGTVFAYRIESKLNDTVWAKMWVDEAGDVLLVETSLGLRMEEYHLGQSSADGREKNASAPVRKWRSRNK
jgi:hypothetical protein